MVSGRGTHAATRSPRAPRRRSLALASARAGEPGPARSIGRVRRPDPVPGDQDPGARPRRRPRRSGVDPGLRPPGRQSERGPRSGHAVSDRLDHQGVHRPGAGEPGRGRRGQPCRSSDQIRARVHCAAVGGRAADPAHRSRHPFGRAAARGPPCAGAAGRSLRQHHPRRLRRLAQGQSADVHARDFGLLLQLRLRSFGRRARPRRA